MKAIFHYKVTYVNAFDKTEVVREFYSRDAFDDFTIALEVLGMRYKVEAYDSGRVLL